MSDLVTHNLPLIATAPDGIKRLRGLILELAVRGKLVPQDPADEPASELLKRIEAEKARLVKEGKIRKPKAMEPVGEDERPFDTPAGWEWVRMNHLDPSYQNGESSRGQSDGVATTVLRLADIKNGSISLEDTRVIQVSANSTEKYALLEGDLLAIRVNGSSEIVGRLILCAEKLPAIYCDHFIRIRISGSYAFPRYLRLLGDTPVVRWQIQSLFITTAGQKTVNQGHLGGLILPLPPLPEQHRIVARVDELMALCDRLEVEQTDDAEAHARLVDALLATLTASRDAAECAAQWQRLREHFDTLFTTEASITALKQTVLQLAVMGRLVPQDPTDEPASELLKRIEAEKARLVKEGEIRKPKAVEPVVEDERPFEVPSGWEWARIGSVVNESGAGWSPSCESRPRKDAHEWGVLKVSAVTWGRFDSDANKALPAHLEPRPEYEVQPGDFLVSRANTAELVARSVFVENCAPRLMLSDKIVRLKLASIVCGRYVNIANSCDHARAYYAAVAGGTSSSMKNVSREQILNLPLSLPPLPEQHRIVAKVDELMALCDRLKADLATAREHRARLADTLVQAALEAA